jgi:hypothetical protein
MGRPRPQGACAASPTQRLRRSNKVGADGAGLLREGLLAISCLTSLSLRCVEQGLGRSSWWEVRFPPASSSVAYSLDPCTEAAKETLSIPPFPPALLSPGFRVAHCGCVVDGEQEPGPWRGGWGGCSKVLDAHDGPGPAGSEVCALNRARVRERVCVMLCTLHLLSAFHWRAGVCLVCTSFWRI